MSEYNSNMAVGQSIYDGAAEPMEGPCLDEVLDVNGEHYARIMEAKRDRYDRAAAYRRLRLETMFGAGVSLDNMEPLTTRQQEIYNALEDSPGTGA